MRIGYPAIDAPNGLAVVRTMDRIQQAFPEGPSPAEVAMTGQDPVRPRGQARARGAAGARRGRRRDPRTGHHGPRSGRLRAAITVPLAGHGTGTDPTARW